MSENIVTPVSLCNLLCSLRYKKPISCFLARFLSRNKDRSTKDHEMSFMKFRVVSWIVSFWLFMLSPAPHAKVEQKQVNQMCDLLLCVIEKVSRSRIDWGGEH
jgi:hypothetical protein